MSNMKTVTINGVTYHIEDGDARAYAKKVGNPHNLLDNSDFRNPVAQAGINGLHGTQKYAVDRWVLDNDLTATKTANGLQIISGGNDWWAGIVQYLEVSRLPKNRTLTFATHGLFNNNLRIYVYGAGTGGGLAVTYPVASTEYKTHLVAFRIPDDFPDEKILVSVSTDTEAMGNAAYMQWAALYEGEYTAETLPEYQPKGYAAEYAQCRRYYRHYFVDVNAFAGALISGTAYITINLNDNPMRVAPSLVGSGKFWVTSPIYTGETLDDLSLHNTSRDGATIKFTVPVTGTSVGIFSKVDSYFALSADL